MRDHWFHLYPAEFPKEEGALIQMAWYLWDCEEIMLDYYERLKAG